MDLSKGILDATIIGIYREKLIRLLNTKGLTREKLIILDEQIRNKQKSGKIPITELNSKTEGNMYLTLHKNEQPINLVLKLKYLLENNIGKILK